MNKVEIRDWSGKITIPASIIEQRFALMFSLMNNGGLDFGNEDRMIAALINANNTALQTGQHIVKQRRPFNTLFISHASKAIGLFGGNAARYGFLLFVEDMHRHPPAWGKGIVNRCLAVNTDQNERWIERYGGEGADRQAAEL